MIGTRIRFGVIDHVSPAALKIQEAAEAIAEKLERAVPTTPEEQARRDGFIREVQDRLGRRVARDLESATIEMMAEQMSVAFAEPKRVVVRLNGVDHELQVTDPAGVTLGEMREAFAEAGLGTLVCSLSSPPSPKETREQARERKLAFLRGTHEDLLLTALAHLPRRRRRAAARHGVRRFMLGGLLPRELETIYACLTDYPDDD